MKKLLFGCGLVLFACSLVWAQRERLPYSIIFSGTTGTAVTADNFFVLGGGVASTTESAVETGVPVNGIFQTLRCRLNLVNDSDEIWVITLRVAGASTGVTCTIAESAQTCSNLVNTAPVEVGQRVDFNFDTTAGAAPSASVRCSIYLKEYF